MQTAKVARTGRSLGGCIGCRKRKRKCDEAHPECYECTRRGLRCPGYRAAVRFLPYEPLSRTFDWVGRGLDAEDPRRQNVSVSDQVDNGGIAPINDIGFAGSQEANITDLSNDVLESGQEQVSFQDDQFGVFTTYQDGSTTSSSTGRDLTAHLTSVSNPTWASRNSVVGTRYIHENTTDTIDCHGNTMLSPAFEVGAASPESESPTGPVESQEPGISLSTDCFAATPQPRLHPNLASHLTASARSSSIAYLISHYRDIAGTFFSPRRTAKLPWIVMHLPSACSILSKVALGESVKAVDNALLNAILSVSAFNLDRMNTAQGMPSDIWWVLGQSFRSHGKLDMQKHLSLDLFNTDTSHYVETLIALLTMATASVIGGQLSEVRSFLLDAQTCICHYLQNGSASNSSKIHMLQQIFLFQRIIEESTFVYFEGAVCEPPPGEATLEYHTLRFPSLQTVYFTRGVRPPPWFPKALERVSERHSTDPEYTSMFEEIYGIPETLLSLISKTTSLSNELMGWTGNGKTMLLDTDLLVRSKELEGDILKWRTAELGISDTSYMDILDNLDTTSEPSLQEIRLSDRAPMGTSLDTPGMDASTSLNLAIYHGLLLYFYRRISNLEPQLLQYHVDAVMKLLRYGRREMVKLGIINCGIVWPGFLAAAEAIGRTRQAGIRSFLRESACISGFRSFDVAMDVAEEVWRLRAEKGNRGATWVDVVSDQGRTVVLT